MLYRQLAEVSTYVTDPSHKFSDVLQMLCIKALSPFQTDALVYTEIDQNGHAIPHTSFGIEIIDKNGERPTFTISERTPFTDAIRENRIIWIDSLPSWPKPYTRMMNLQLPKNLKTMICCPIDVDGLPIGSLTAFSHAKIEFEEATAQYLEAISHILSNAIYNQSNSKRRNSRERDDSKRSETFAFDPAEYEKPLSERQNLILKLISEGRTNAAIADVLGYSESLIRQETIKIYAKLGCSGRNEAAQIYNRMNSQKASIAV
jgi:DNA-binding CsgD family transcriptional regulator